MSIYREGQCCGGPWSGFIAAKRDVTSFEIMSGPVFEGFPITGATPATIKCTGRYEWVKGIDDRTGTWLWIPE